MSTAPSLRESRAKRPSTIPTRLLLPSPPAPLEHVASAAPAEAAPASGPPLDPAALFDLRKQPGYYNAAEKVALLRRAKKQPHDELWVDFRASDVQLRLAAAGVTLIEGPWTWQASVAGQPLAAAGAWRESCWNRDADCDYLEIELPLAGGWKLDRQFLLARKDRFLFVADALIGPAAGASGQPTNGSPRPGPPAGSAAEIHYAASLPLADSIAFAPANQTREAWLVGRSGLPRRTSTRDVASSRPPGPAPQAGPTGKRRATLIAPALAEWRAEFCHADLTAEDGRLMLRQASLGCHLYAPLFVDLDPARCRRAVTWRRLTVAEHLHIVPRDVAVAYRVQVGREQWLFYRSLAPRGNRTFLGQNYSSEFVCTRFRADGTAKDILAIE